MIVVFDIDGVLADDAWRWHLYRPNERCYGERNEAWNAYYADARKDEPIEAFCAIASTFMQTPLYKVVFATGRPERIRDDTYEWLRRNVFYLIHPDRLLMRQPHQRGANSQMKLEHLASIREKFGEPDLWFDDNPHAVDALLEAGVRVVKCPSKLDWGVEHPHP